MSERVKLGDIADISVGFPFESGMFNIEGRGIRLVRGVNVTERELRFGIESRWWDDESVDLKPYLLAENDIVVGMDGSKVGKNFAVIKKDELPLLLVQRVASIRAKDGISQKFLWAWISSSVFSRYVDLVKTGSTIFHISGDQIRDFTILLPDYNTQEKLGTLIFNLDTKIANNNAINAELEALAKTIYDYWFLQFEFPNEEGLPYKSSGGRMVWSEELKREIPEGWGVGTLKDYGEIVAGGTPDTENPEFYCEHGISWITPKDLSITNDMYISHGERDITELGLKKSSAVLMPKGSVLMSSRAPIGYLAISLNEITTNQGFKSIVPKKEYGSEFVYYTLRTYVPAFIKKSGQTTFKEVSKGTLEEFSTFVPDERVLTLFNSIIRPIGEKRALLEKENRELAAIRDWLLPMLMNGQVGFKEDVR